MVTIYPYRCSCHGNLDVDFPMGTAPLHVACPDGGRAVRVYGSARISAYATPNKPGFARISEVDQTEARWATDLPAYKRLRKKGLQPPGTEGAAALENRVETQFDINYRRALDTAAQSGGGGKDRVVNAVGEVGGVM